LDLTWVLLEIRFAGSTGAVAPFFPRRGSGAETTTMLNVRQTGRHRLFNHKPVEASPLVPPPDFWEFEIFEPAGSTFPAAPKEKT
jgi:hypothetical protein